jgi:hypothetical protein
MAFFQLARSGDSNPETIRVPICTRSAPNANAAAIEDHRQSHQQRRGGQPAMAREIQLTDPDGDRIRIGTVYPAE